MLSTTEAAAQARLNQVAMLKLCGATGLKAPTAALLEVQSHRCLRVQQGANQMAALPVAAEVIVLWCPANDLAGWCCVPEGRPGAELLPLVRREGRLPQ
ncbi:hypothetical protein [Cyanobium sp. ATX-6F1]|uniref:hypothetical protein n=1 Tax=Cyanobium sp. ATX-6F1 TaxID=3137388 RepID=UPI0039BE723D